MTVRLGARFILPSGLPRAGDLAVAGVAVLLLAVAFAGPALAVAPPARPSLNTVPRGEGGAPPNSQSPMDAFQRELVRLSRRSASSMVTIVAQLDPVRVGESPSREPLRQRKGSGILVDADGSIVSTYSNVESAYALYILTESGRMIPATLIGADKVTNIALLSARGSIGQPARLGESGLVAPGSPVLVVGGLVAGGPQAVPMSSFGVVEVDRGLVVRYSELEMFRTNTPLLPGSIGAAVIGMDGRVVGMVAGSLTSAQTTGGGLSGVIYGNRLMSAHCSSPTLVVPIERAQEIAAELREYGRIMRGFLGILMQPTIDPPMPGMGERGRLGVMVKSVKPGSPADRVGLRPGDRILSYSGSEIHVADELAFLIASTRPGSTMPIVFERTGQRYEVSVPIGCAPEDKATRMNGTPSADNGDAPPARPQPAMRFQRGGGASPALSPLKSAEPTRGRSAGKDSTRPGGH